MRIISHRGYWIEASEKNTLKALERSFSLGIGVETDFRDFDGELVISHDLATNGVPRVDSVLERFAELTQDAVLAINIKSDGLQALLSSRLKSLHIDNYFLFDMSVPDLLQSLKSGLHCFSRQSEYEREPILYDRVQGVWLDCFESIWYGEKVLQDHLSNGKQVCLVSPELHGRAPEALWQSLDEWSVVSSDNLILCTDRPVDAMKRFSSI